MGLFKEVFQVQRQYLKADSHLWFSVVTRPTRSRLYIHFFAFFRNFIIRYKKNIYFFIQQNYVTYNLYGIKPYISVKSGNKNQWIVKFTKFWIK